MAACECPGCLGDSETQLHPQAPCLEQTQCSWVQGATNILSSAASSRSNSPLPGPAAQAMSVGALL